MLSSQLSCRHFQHSMWSRICQMIAKSLTNTCCLLTKIISAKCDITLLQLFLQHHFLIIACILNCCDLVSAGWVCGMSPCKGCYYNFWILHKHVCEYASVKLRKCMCHFEFVFVYTVRAVTIPHLVAFTTLCVLQCQELNVNVCVILIFCHTLWSFFVDLFRYWTWKADNLIHWSALQKV